MECSNPKTVQCRLLCISDTHSGRESTHNSPTFNRDGAFAPPFPEADILIHAGDLSMTGKESEFKAALDLLQHFRAELKLVIPGNHDVSLDTSWYKSNPTGPEGGELFGFQYDPDLPMKVQDFWSSKAVRDAGVLLLGEGLHHFKLSNGAEFTVYASPWQPEFCNWAFNYPEREDRWNPVALIKNDPAYQWNMKTGRAVVSASPSCDPHPIPEETSVDIVITHGPGWGHLDTCEPTKFQAGCPHLLKALQRVKPRLHVFGHIHEGWGAHRVRWAQSRQSQSANGVARKIVIGSLSEGIKPNDEDVRTRKAAAIDVSNTSESPLEDGRDTLFLNAAIVDIDYQPHNAAWLVDMELPRG